MGLLSDFQKNEDGRLLESYITNYGTFLQNMENMLDSIKRVSVKYPGEEEEIIRYILPLKEKTKAVLDKY